MSNPSEHPALDLMYAMAKRAGELGDHKIDSLRSIAGYNCDTEAEAISMNKHYGRGHLIETILTEEFEDQANDVDNQL